MENLVISPVAMSKIVNIISNELLKRSIITEVYLIQKKDVVEVSSKSFQTSPVIFKSLNIVNIGGLLKIKDIKFVDKYNLTIPIGISLTTFNGDVSYLKLFEFTCIVLNSDNDIYGWGING